MTSTSQQSTQTATSRRSGEAELRRLVAKLAPAHRRVIGAVRESLRTRLATAHEAVYAYRDCLVISFSPTERGYEGVLTIRANAHGVKRTPAAGRWWFGRDGRTASPAWTAESGASRTPRRLSLRPCCLTWRRGWEEWGVYIAWRGRRRLL